MGELNQAEFQYKIELWLSTRNGLLFSVITKGICLHSLYFVLLESENILTEAADVFFFWSLNPWLHEFFCMWALLLPLTWNGNGGVNTWLLTALLMNCRCWKIIFWLQRMYLFPNTASRAFFALFLLLFSAFFSLLLFLLGNHSELYNTSVLNVLLCYLLQRSQRLQQCPFLDRLGCVQFEPAL